MKKLANKIRKFLANFEYKDQTFSDNNYTYNVYDIYQYVKKHAPLKSFSVDELFKTSFGEPSNGRFDEEPGSKEFVDRANKASLTYPIIVIKYNDGLIVADGNHRLWKAKSLGNKYIKGYFLTEKDLENIPKV